MPYWELAKGTGLKALCVCRSPTESFSMEVECHMLPEGNEFDKTEVREKMNVVQREIMGKET